MQPANIDRNPYYLSVLIGMAQARFHADSSSPALQTSGHSARSGTVVAIPKTFHDVTVQLLITHDKNKDFIVYMATVPGAFLERFAQPHKVPSSTGDAPPPGIKVAYTRVPIGLILGLKERLGKALGRTIVGKVLGTNPDDISLQNTVIRSTNLPRESKRRWTVAKDAD